MVKTSLDDLYFAWSVNPSSDNVNALLDAVRIASLKAFRRFPTRHEDIAQEVSMLVWEKLAKFVPDGRPQPFTRWMSTIFRRTRLEAYRATPHVSSDGLPELAVEEHTFIDIADLPAGMKEVATSLLSGYSLKETAQRMNLKEGTLRKRLHAHRNR